jgi:phosphate-selective porin OprO/OprP
MLLLGSASMALATGAYADKAQSNGTSSSQSANDAKIQQLEQDIQNLNAQVQDLKRSSSDQYADIQKTQASGAKFSMKNGRPTFIDGDFSLSLRALVQYDTAYYMQGKSIPASTDFSSGSNFRRARFGFEGTAFTDWQYNFIYDFGASGVEASSISSAYIQYNGLAPVHFRIGAFPPSESFDDTTSASDLLFLERAQPTDLARGIAGSDGRDAFQIFAYDDNYFASVAYTGTLAGTGGQYDEQQALVGRAAFRPIASDDVNLAFGGDFTYVVKLPDTSPGPNSPHLFSLSERPELNVDDQNIKLISSGNIDASHVFEWGGEIAGNFHNFYGQGGYFGFTVNRRPLGNPSNLSDPHFNGWYLQGSWILTGETKKWKTDTGSFGAPKPNDPFTIDKAGIGAWEIAARYSDLDLNYHAGALGSLPAPDAIRGGDQRIGTVGVNWYPNQVLRFMLDYQRTDVSRLSPAGARANTHESAISLRTQISF